MFEVKALFPTVPANAHSYKIGWYIYGGDPTWRNSARYDLVFDYLGPYKYPYGPAGSSNVSGSISQGTPIELIAY